MGEMMRAADRDREENMRRFELLTEVMIAGFGRLEGKLDDVKQEVAGVKQEVAEVKQEVAGVKQEVAGVKQEVTGIKQEVAGIKQEVVGLNKRVDVLTDEQRTMNRRLQATFDQTGQLTEQVTDVDMRLTRTEQVVPTNAELDARLREVENRLRNAS